MRASSTSERQPPSNAKETKPRQQPGLACEECRARKLRCDRALPHCGTCQAIGIVCNRNTVRQPRGPKAGHIRALKARIAALERRLERRLGENSEELSDELSDESFHVVQRKTRSVEQHSDESRGLVPEQDLSGDQQPEFPSDTLAEPSAELGNASHSNVPFDNQAPRQAEHNESEQSEHQISMPHEGQQFSHGSVTQLRADLALHNSLINHASHVDFALMPTETRTLPQVLSPSITFETGMQKSFDGFASPFNFSLMSTEPKSLLQSLGSTSNSCESSSEFSMSGLFTAAPPLEMSDLMRADLDHLYFDRVHPSAPILNQRRYFARAARASDPVGPFTSLQYAMWTLASSMGTQFQHIQSKLYSYARTLLETWETEALTDSIPIEHTQAWTLMAIYEITQSNYQLGWITAGHCFRLVQLMKLYEIDMPQAGSDASPSNLTWVEIESRRRTFWIAYTLDRCINLVDQLPLTLSEQVISTRIPAPESAFQREQPVQTEFLSEVMARLGEMQLPPFTDSIVLVTISGRCLSYQQQCNVERVYGNTPQEFSSHYEWLDQILSRKIQPSFCSGSGGEPAQPLLLFASMVAQATTLLLCTPVVKRHEERALRAAQNILCLAQKLTEFSYFKVHPFTPIPLFFCAKFLRSRKDLDPAFHTQFQALCDALSHLCPVNKLAQTCLLKLNPSPENEN